MPSDPRTGAAAPIEENPRRNPGAPEAPSVVNPPIAPGPEEGPTSPSTGPAGGPGTGGPGPVPGAGGTAGTPQPGGGPGGGPDDDSGSDSTTGGDSGGSGGTGGTDADGGAAANATDDSFGTAISGTLLQIVENATGADALEAQTIILRRIALQGDVVPSRVPPPRNITEIGGYLNLLENLHEFDMRSQVLAGILGVAGPNPPLGWLETATPLSLATLSNDRPQGPAQRTIPLTVPVRSDFAGSVRAALESLHNLGCQVPFAGGPWNLPTAGSNATVPFDVMPYLGRVLVLASAMALTDPTTDALALIRAQASTGPFEVAANASQPGADSVTPGNYEALQCTPTACTTVTLTAAKMVPLSPAFAAAGFYIDAPLAQPASSTDTAWARLTNVTGLASGTTTLGDELALLYSWSSIASSVFANRLTWVWNGSTFAAHG